MKGMFREFDGVFDFIEIIVNVGSYCGFFYKLSNFFVV